MKASTAANGMTFGEAPIFSSDNNAVYNLSGDKQAFDIKFDIPPAAGVGSPVFDGLTNTDAPVSTRSYSVVIPVSGKNLKTTFFVNGFGLTEAGTNTWLMLSVNGKHSVTRFGPNQDEQDFVAALPYRAKADSDVRLTVVLGAERDAAHPDASALIAINAITTDALLANAATAKRGANRAKRTRT